MKKIRWATSWLGFGIGVWRSLMYSDHTIWTVSIGPVCIYLDIYRTPKLSTGNGICDDPTIPLERW